MAITVVARRGVNLKPRHLPGPARAHTGPVGGPGPGLARGPEPRPGLWPSARASEPRNSGLIGMRPRPRAGRPGCQWQARFEAREPEVTVPAADRRGHNGHQAVTVAVATESSPTRSAPSDSTSESVITVAGSSASPGRRRPPGRAPTFPGRCRCPGLRCRRGPGQASRRRGLS